MGFDVTTIHDYAGREVLRKEKGGRENDEDIVAKISQDLLQIQANYI
jgi:hypothetical protein